LSVVAEEHPQRHDQGGAIPSSKAPDASVTHPIDERAFENDADRRRDKNSGYLQATGRVARTR
jgi:hypothetical protein